MSVRIEKLLPGYEEHEYIARVRRRNDELLAELRAACRRGKLVLFLGAGVSCSLGLPNWNALIKSMADWVIVRRIRRTQRTSSADVNSGPWMRAIRALKYDGSPLILARALKNELRERFHSTVAGGLYRGLRNKPLPQSELVASLISLFARRRIHAVVNYNFDDLFEEHLRAANVRSRVIAAEDERAPRGEVPMVHVHGLLPMKEYFALGWPANPRWRGRGHLVFSEDEYHAEYADPTRWSNRVQVAHLTRYTSLFVGMSLQDPDIRRLLDATHQAAPSVARYAILTRATPPAKRRTGKHAVPRNLFEDIETQSLEGIGVRALLSDDYDEVPRLIRAIARDDAERPRHPARRTGSDRIVSDGGR